MNVPIQIHVLEADVTKVQSDLLLLKYAQSRYGADLVVAGLLVNRGLCEESEISPRPGDYAIIDTKNCMAPARVMFLGTSDLVDFTYDAMAEFAELAATSFLRAGLPIRHVTTTVHGVGYGLDASESLRSIVIGILTAASRGRTGILEKITIVERKATRAGILAAYLEANIHEWLEIARIKGNAESFGRPSLSSEVQSHERPQITSTPSERRRVAAEKDHVFVAMPFSDEFEDVYEFGIYAPVRQCGYICEHVGQAAFTGDVLNRIKERIGTAKFMIADLTLARPNVYLEVGYAWGRDVPVIILARKGEDLHFDVSTHRCIYYRNITHLGKELTELIRGL